MPDRDPKPTPGTASLPGVANVAITDTGLRQSTQLEQTAAAFALAPDAAAIARLANAFFTTRPGSLPLTPGAALPSAPVFAAEPAYAAIPGAPNVSLPLTPNHNPGPPVPPFPGAGAAQPSAPVFAVEPRYDPDRLPRAAAVQPANATPPSASVPTEAAAIAATPGVERSFLDAPDLNAIPVALEGALTLIPRFDDALGIAGAFAALPGQAESAAASSGAYWLPNKIQAVPGTEPASKAWPADPSTQSLDLSSLVFMHRPQDEPIALSGVRQFDAHIFRRDFPILDQSVNGRPLVWLDNGATTQKPQSVINRLVRFYQVENSNVHRAAHTLAARATDAYESAREKVRRFINAPSVRDIVFVRGTTEGINFVAQSWGRRNVRKDDEIIITHLEHHANIVPWQQLAAEKEARLLVVPVDDSGQVLLDEYEKLFSPRTRIVAFTHVSNALGTVTPAQEMTAIARRHGARVLIDGAQSISHMPVDVQALDADFFVFSGHKMFAPTGIGVVYGKAAELEAMPPWQGGGSMIVDVTFEKTIFQGVPERFEAGTGNIADAVGLGAAIDYLNAIGMNNIAAYEHELMAYMLAGLVTVPGLRLVGAPRERAGVVSFVLDECKTEDVGKALDREGIAVRAGHHCAQPILRRFGLEATVRPSLALYNTPEDIDALIDALLRIQSGRRHAR